jgi:hypothetical protein
MVYLIMIKNPQKEKKKKKTTIITPIINMIVERKRPV